jgi:hypothetical protein
METTYIIEKKTPATNWTTIHRDMSRETAEYILKDIAEKYGCALKPFDNLESFGALENGDMHDFRIVEAGS